MNRAAVQQVAERVASYQDVAFEYYDGARHPTCRDLRELSMRFLVPRLRMRMPVTGSLVEIGPGLSALAPEASATGALSRVILVDNSTGMLSYSRRWTSGGARSIIASADATGLASRTASLIVCSLGDPYNSPLFWREVMRILEPGGACLFTTPSFEWASRFRQDGERDLAEFVRADGARLSMPSYVSDGADQVRMIEAAGLVVEERQGLGIEALDTEPAPKLLCVEPGTPIVAAYVVRAPR